MIDVDLPQNDAKLKISLRHLKIELMHIKAVKLRGSELRPTSGFTFRQLDENQLEL